MRQIWTEPTEETEAVADAPTPGVCAFAMMLALAPADETDAPALVASAVEVAAFAVDVGRTVLVRTTVVLPARVAMVWLPDVEMALLATCVVLTAEAEPQSTCEFRTLRQICTEPTIGTVALAEAPTPALATLPAKVPLTPALPAEATAVVLVPLTTATTDAVVCGAVVLPSTKVVLTGSETMVWLPEVVTALPATMVVVAPLPVTTTDAVVCGTAVLVRIAVVPPERVAMVWLPEVVIALLATWVLVATEDAEQST